MCLLAYKRKRILAPQQHHGVEHVDRKTTLWLNDNADRTLTTRNKTSSCLFICLSVSEKQFGRKWNPFLIAHFTSVCVYSASLSTNNRSEESKHFPAPHKGVRLKGQTRGRSLKCRHGDWRCHCHSSE